jgi:hypothetical protein
MTNNETESLVLETTTEKSSFEKPKIRPGPYAGRLIAVKPFKDKDGKWNKPEQGKQLILDFEVYKIQFDEDNEEDPGVVSKQMVIKKDNVEIDVKLSQFVYFMYAKSDKDKKLMRDDNGQIQYKTALAPGSKPTLIFQALGWKGPEKDEAGKSKPLEVAKLVGNWVNLLVEDYDAKDKDGNTTGVTQSVIKSITTLKAKVPAELNTPLESKAEKKEDEQPKAVEENIGDDAPTAPSLTSAQLEKIGRLNKQLRDGEITEKGHAIAVENIKKGG